MTRLWMTIALLAAAPALSATEPPHGIENDYLGWQSVKVDQAAGAAFFVTPPQRAGDAVQFEMLAVYRDLHRPTDVGMRGAELDKEIFRFLGDCGSGTLLQTGYRYQKETEPVAPTISPMYRAEVPSRDSAKAIALGAVCRIPQNPGIVVPPGFIRDPYAWAKQRLNEPR